MSTITFLNYRGFRWLWISIISLLIFSGVYLWNRPPGGNNGGTVLGYTYGVIATIGILYLMWFGMRKRSYRSSTVPLKHHLSAHVWIGISLLLLVPLHCGFQFGWNIHTITYGLLVATVFSGIWGAFNYVTLPAEVRSHRGGGTTAALVEQIENLSSTVAQMVSGKSDTFIALLQQIDFEFKPSLFSFVRGTRFGAIDRKDAADKIVQLPPEEREDGMKLISTINKKIELAERVRDEASVHFWLKIWLFFHLPLSFGLVAALTIHIVSVFWYR